MLTQVTSFSLHFFCDCKAKTRKIGLATLSSLALTLQKKTCSDSHLTNFQFTDTMSVYFGTLENWGADDSSYTVVGVFTDLNTAWKNVLRSEYLNNVQMTPMPWRHIDEGMLGRAKDSYTMLYVQLFKPGWECTPSFLDAWNQSRRLFLGLFDNFGDSGKVVKQSIVAKDHLVGLGPHETILENQTLIEHLQIK